MSTQSAAEQIFRLVPDPFTRQDVLEAGKALHYSYSTASGAVQQLQYMDMVERIATGKYRKLEPEIPDFDL